MKHPLKILLVGLGGIGQRHARNLRALMGSELELSAYRLRRNANALTDKMQIEAGIDIESKLDLKIFTTLDDALAEKPDAVIISNPTSMHLSVAHAAAEAGCHLFIEKPIKDDKQAKNKRNKSRCLIKGNCCKKQGNYQQCHGYFFSLGILCAFCVIF